MQLWNVFNSLLLAVSFGLHKREYLPDIFKKSAYFAVCGFSGPSSDMVNGIGFKQAAGS